MTTFKKLPMQAPSKNKNVARSQKGNSIAGIIRAVPDWASDASAPWVPVTDPGCCSQIQTLEWPGRSRAGHRGVGLK